MKFCPVCARVMLRDTSGSTVAFKCLVCQTAVDGTDEDARIGGAVVGQAETAMMYDTVIRVSPFDRVNQQVLRSCEGCGRDYMTLIRVGSAEAIYFTCVCGALLTGAEAEAKRTQAEGKNEDVKVE